MGGDVGCALIGGCWHREAGSRLTRRGMTYIIGLQSIFGFLVGPELEAGGEEQKLGKLTVNEQILNFLD